ncbi:MAG TPA: phospholipid-binding protein, partial [Telluria sp.]|nr:phospholipid-binding protein [Telluria sp.]
MKLWSDSFNEGGPIPPQCAFAVIDPAAHVRLSSNRNPHLAWDDVPAGTQSLILFCHDLDAPTVGADVNREGREVADDLPRTDFYHWTLVDIPVALKALSEGLFSELVTPHGKPGPLV